MRWRGPQSGPHFMGNQGADKVLRSTADTAGNPQRRGARDSQRRHRLLRQRVVRRPPRSRTALATNQGEYNVDYEINAGSYYEKAWTAMLMTESVDNFISASRRDFLDARYRAVSIADVFPDGYPPLAGQQPDR